jgi:hypothetical protein
MSTPRGRARRWRAWLLGLTLGLGALGPVAPGEAAAAPTRAERSEARAAWVKGRREAARRRWEEAAAAFRAADALDPKVQYELDLARALFAQNLLREAGAVLDRIDASKEPNSGGVRRAAGELRRRIERRLATIVVEVSGPASGLVVEVDDEEVEAGDAIRVAPGKHLVRASAEGWVTMEQTVELRERQTEAVTFTLERDPSVAHEEEPLPAAAHPEDDEREQVPDGGGTLLPAAIAWGVGGAGLALGTVFGVFAFDEAEKARENCVDDVCPEANVPALDASRNNGTASTVFFAIGGAGVVTGVVLAIVYGGGDGPAAGDGATASTKAAVRPWIGAGEIGVAGRF